MAHNWGDFTNNMIVDCPNGLYNAANQGQPLRPCYNLFWNCDEPSYGQEGGFIWGQGNIFDQEPLFNGNDYRLRDGSPGINLGDPSIEDIDGTRSDIGVYGGPYAYPAP